MATKRAASVVEIPCGKRLKKDRYDLKYKDFVVYASCGENESFVNIRKMQNDELSKTGVAIKESEWEALLTLFTKISDSFDNYKERLWCIGERNLFVSVSKSDFGNVKIDIRFKFETEGKLLYTRRGCCLNETAFLNLMKYANNINEDLQNKK